MWAVYLHNENYLRICWKLNHLRIWHALKEVKLNTKRRFLNKNASLHEDQKNFLVLIRIWGHFFEGKLAPDLSRSYRENCLWVWREKNFGRTHLEWKLVKESETRRYIAIIFSLKKLFFQKWDRESHNSPNKSKLVVFFKLFKIWPQMFNICQCNQWSKLMLWIWVQFIY